MPKRHHQAWNQSSSGELPELLGNGIIPPTTERNPAAADLRPARHDATSTIDRALAACDFRRATEPVTRIGDEGDRYVEAIGLFSSQQQAVGLPGAFADYSPDRWGKNLTIKKVQAQALREARAAPSLGGADRDDGRRVWVRRPGNSP